MQYPTYIDHNSAAAGPRYEEVKSAVEHQTAVIHKRLSHLTQRASEVDARLHSTASRLLGNEPTTGAADNNKPTPCGALGEIVGEIERIATLLGSIEDAANRLERA